jgi:hypothetical protein
VEAAAAGVDPSTNPAVNRILIDMHHWVFRHFSKAWLDAAPQVLGRLRSMVEGLPGDVSIDARYSSLIPGEGRPIPQALSELSAAHNMFVSVNEGHRIAAEKLRKSLFALEHVADDFDESSFPADLRLSPVERAIVARGFAPVVLACDEELKRVLWWQERRSDAFDRLSELFAAGILPPSFVYGRSDTLALYRLWRDTTDTLFRTE